MDKAMRLPGLCCRPVKASRHGAAVDSLLTCSDWKAPLESIPPIWEAANPNGPRISPVNKANLAGTTAGLPASWPRQGSSREGQWLGLCPAVSAWRHQVRCR